MKSPYYLLTTLSLLCASVASAQTRADALDQSDVIVTTSGNTSWQPQTKITHDGVDALQSGIIRDNQEAGISITVEGPGDLSYWWKVSSEANADYLYFYLDGGEVYHISGEVDWEQKTVQIPAGTHEVSWVYEKDISLLAGSDMGWIDQLSGSVFNNPPQITSAVAFETVGWGDAVTLNAAATGSGTITYQWLKDGQPLEDGTKYAGTQTTSLTVNSAEATDTGAYSLKAVNDFGDTTQKVAELHAYEPLTATIQGEVYSQYDGIKSLMQDLTVDGTRVYTSNAAAGWTVYETADPSRILQLDRVDDNWGAYQESETYDVQISNGRAYVSSGDRGLLVYSLTEGGIGDQIGSYPVYARRAIVSGDTIYLAGMSSFEILDASTPYNITSLGTTNAVAPRNVVVEGQIAYVDNEIDFDTDSVVALDLSDPANIQTLGSYEISGDITKLALEQGRLAVSSDAGAVELLDVADPANLSSLGSYATGGITRGVDLAGDTVYVADEQAGLIVLDFSTPSTPVSIASVADVSAFDVEAEGDRAYFSTQTGLHVLDTATPAAPQAIGQFEAAFWYQDLAPLGDQMLVNGSGTPLLFDTANPSQIFQIETPWEGTDAVALAVKDDVLYLATGGKPQLDVYDIHDPAAPELLATLPLSIGPNEFLPNDIRVFGDQLLVANALGAVTLFDLTTPAAPANARGLIIEGGPTPVDFALNGNVLTVLTQNSIHTYRVDDFFTALDSETSATSSNFQSLEVVDNHARVLAASGGEVAIFDLTDPANITEVQNVHLADNLAGLGGHDLLTVGDTTIVPSNYGLAFLDMTDPGFIYARGVVTLDDRSPLVSQVAVQGQRIYAIGSDGIVVLEANWLPVVSVPSLDADADGLPDAWEMQQFGGLSRDAHYDPDMDGLGAQLEYAIGGDPLVADADEKLMMALYPDSSTVGLVFNTIADGNLTYIVETSTDLLNWQSIWSSTGEMNVGTEVTVTDPSPASDDSSKFIRLRVEYHAAQ